MITSDPLTPQSTTVRFLLDGKIKTLNPPLTGRALYQIAGEPEAVYSGGKLVPNDMELFEIGHDQDFHTDSAKAAQHAAETKPATEPSPFSTGAAELTGTGASLSVDGEAHPVGSPVGTVGSAGQTTI